jgi:hypothetical protein
MVAFDGVGRTHAKRAIQFDEFHTQHFTYSKEKTNLIGKYRHDCWRRLWRKRRPELGSTGQARIDGG